MATCSEERNTGVAQKRDELEEEDAVTAAESQPETKTCGKYRLLCGSSGRCYLLTGAAKVNSRYVVDYRFSSNIYESLILSYH